MTVRTFWGENQMRILLAWFCLGMSVAGTGAVAADKATHTYSVGKHGSISLPVDGAWRETPPAPNAPTITWDSATPGKFELLITPIPVAAGKTQSDADVRTLVDKSAREMAPQSQEKNLPLSPLAGVEAKGYMFHATDPNPKPGEFKYLYQGAVAVGNVLATFTVLYNNGGEVDARSALASVQALHYAPPN
jgi:hypothetical protein